MTKTGLLADAFFVTLHGQRTDSRLARRSDLALAHHRRSCDFVEPGQWRLRSCSDIRHPVCDSHLRWNWRRRLRSGGADDSGRSVPDRHTRSHHGDLLCSDSSWERARLCRSVDWWVPVSAGVGPFILLRRPACCWVCCAFCSAIRASLRINSCRNHHAEACEIT